MKTAGLRCLFVSVICVICAMRIAIAADHRGFSLKVKIVEFLGKNGHRVLDYGTNSRELVDYPAFALKVAVRVAQKKAKYGILVCYTGQGMAMMANKVKGIRAALCTKPEVAALARSHNDANVLVMPGSMRFSKNTQNIITSFIATEFEGGRHRRRLRIIEQYEKKNL